MPRLADTAVQRIAGLVPFPQPPIIPLRHPVVLMHGFGLFGGLRRNGHLHDAAMHLRLHGVRAYAPNVPPYNPVRIRAAVWKERIAHVIEETGCEKINLIAHSMGGLDARYLISKLGLHEWVQALVTVSTPHHGTCIANLILEQPVRVRAWLTDFANWMGTNVMAETESDFLNTVTELTPEYMTTVFNPGVEDHPSVKYWSYAGHAGRGTECSISPILRPLNHLVYNREGENDGYVSTLSARWGEFLGLIEADHAQQLGIQFPIGSNFDANAFYTEVIRLLADRSF